MMADDMANGSDDARKYSDAAQAQLGERVTNMGRRINDVEVEMRAGFNQLSNSVSASTNETRQSIAALSTTLAERNRPQYQALGFGLSVILAVGALAYWPMRESTSDLKAANLETIKTIQMVAANTVSRQEMDWRAARGVEDRTTMQAAIAELRSGTVARAEWTERNRAYDQQATDFNRRLDELRQDFGSVYGTRDVIQDMKRELEDLRRKQAPPPT